MKTIYYLFLLAAFMSQKVLGQMTSIYTNEEIVKSEKYINGNKYQKDFLLFENLLEKRHPKSYCEKLPFDSDSLRIAGYDYVSDLKSEIDFSYYIQSIISLLEDGHTIVNEIYNSELLYPFQFLEDDNGIHLFAAMEKDNSHIGKQVMSLNGIKIEDVINKFCNIISAGNPYEYGLRFLNFVNRYSTWQNVGLVRSDSTLVLEFTDGTSLNLKPLDMKGQRLSNKIKPFENNPRQYNKQPFSYKILSEKNICYLQFDKCMDRESLRSQYANTNLNEAQRDKLEENLKKIPVFEEVLNEMFSEIENQQVKTLVIDVRYNGGGNSILCNNLLSRLSSKSIKTHSITYISNSSSMQPDAPDVIKYNNNFLPSYNSGDNKSTFKGNVIFLQGKNTYSSAGILITNAVDNNIDIVVGDRSTFSPTHYGDILNWTLPNTGIQITMSSKYFIRPNEMNIANYIEPDVYIPMMCKDLIDGSDKCWEWIINNY